ncbi:MAG: hypothetical protein EOO27_26765 [Comamonadaceae bacterium]|nr:MAG: hypothetical protein EOO27_26765 [Comamonadaceae bacterium]
MTKTYAQLNKEIAALQAEAKKLYAIELKGVVNKVNELIAKHSLTPEDLSFPGISVSGPKPKALAKSAGSTAKYSDGKGNAWGGRGPRPAWLRNAIAAGRSLESFQSTAASASVLPKPASAKTASTGKAIGKRPAKFKDAHGNSWSGRGSRPRWLQAALKKRGARIEDFLIDRTDAVSTPIQTVAAPASAPMKTSSSDADARKSKSPQAAKTPPATAGVTKGRSRAVSSQEVSRVSPAKAVAAKSVSKSQPAAKSAAKKSDGAKGAKAVPKPSAAASAAKPGRDATSTPAIGKGATSAPAKKAAPKKLAVKATPRRPAATKQTTGALDVPTTPAVAAPAAPAPASETPSIAG